MKAPTIKDIAKQLDIHHSTVSRALRNHPDISPKTRKLVISTAEQLDYRPNPVALSLRGYTCRNLGILLPHVAKDGYSELLGHILSITAECDLISIVLQSENEGKGEARAVEQLLKHQFAGAILMPSDGTGACEHFAPVLRSNLKLVAVGRQSCLRVPKVLLNHEKAVVLAVEHLTQQGARRIAIVLDDEKHDLSTQLVNSYREALLENFSPVLAKFTVFGARGRKDGIAAARHLMTETDRPDGIIAVNSRIAAGILEELNTSPSSARVLSLMDDPVASHTQPGITAIRFAPRETAQRALSLLLHLINGEPEVHADHVEYVEPQLIARGSTQ